VVAAGGYMAAAVQKGKDLARWSAAALAVHQHRGSGTGPPLVGPSPYLGSQLVAIGVYVNGQQVGSSDHSSQHVVIAR